MSICEHIWAYVQSNSPFTPIPFNPVTITSVYKQLSEFLSHKMTSEMLEIVSIWTSVELMISGEVVSRISTAMESRRRALNDTPSPSPSFRSWCSSIRVYWRVEPYMLTQAGPRVGRYPAEQKCRERFIYNTVLFSQRYDDHIFISLCLETVENKIMIKSTRYWSLNKETPRTISLDLDRCLGLLTCFVSEFSRFFKSQKLLLDH